ncbi:MAG TPA: hypothetical protein PK913_15995 [Phenylobacterium sp.]|jgi:hypothetical protein|uniref:HTH crp-type domain-containing protein n=1 Tax=Phenylobacterium conjunctum TaxID=1298959 RepID=A0ABW3T2F0_9CAUL|nr:hypothetical protein [Phenylobacterium sp.]HQP18813.1 hypothetical protein [Phenylobacterium sp.]
MQIDLVDSEAAAPGALMAAALAVEGFCLRRAEAVTGVHGLGPTAAVIYRTLCVAAVSGSGEADAEGGLRWVSRTSLAESCGLPRETVRRKCEVLVEAGLIHGDRVRGVTPKREALAASLGPGSWDTLIRDLRHLTDALHRLGVLKA